MPCPDCDETEGCRTTTATLSAPAALPLSPPSPSTRTIPRPARRPAAARSTYQILLHAGVKKLRSLVRSVGGVPTYPGWQARAEICARCPVAVTIKGHLYCGRPLLSDLHRRPEEGCGCPILAKAKDPAEHCPVSPQLLAASQGASPSSPCACKWCSARLAVKAA